MKPSGLSNGYNPRWLAFLIDKGLTTNQAEAMERHTRTSLNAEFMCWHGVAKRPRGRPRTGFDKKAYDRERMKRIRAEARAKGERK